MVHVTLHQYKDYIIEIVAACSFLHTFLPPWDWNPDFVSEGLKEFPTAQKLFHGFFNNRWYRFFIYVIGYVGINMRSTIWKYISVQNPKGPNYSVQQSNEAGGTTIPAAKENAP